MTEKEKNDIIELRKMNYQVPFIADYVGTTVANVKGVCNRYGIKPLERYAEYDPPEHISTCQFCGKVVAQKTRRKKEYCSSFCRRNAWYDRKKLKKRLDFNPASSDELDGGKKTPNT